MKISKRNESHYKEFEITLERMQRYSKDALAEVEVLIDIGCSDGRFISASRSLFPKLKRCIGIDPISEYTLVTEFEYVCASIGSECSKIDFSISEDLFTSSKLYPGSRSITATQFRAECLLNNLEIEDDAAIFVKIDTQGSDLECLESFGKYLNSISMGLLEVQMKPFAEGMSYFSESVAELSKLGFEVCEIVNPIDRSLDKTLGQVDLMVLPQTSVMMRDTRW